MGLLAALRHRRRYVGARERVLAVAAADGLELLGTRSALHVVPVDGGAQRRHAWEQVHSAGWDAASSRFVLRETSSGRAEPEVHEFGLHDATRLLDLVHERVQASVLVQRGVPVAGGEAQVALRRSPNGSGATYWSVLWPDADNGPTEVCLAAVEAEVERLRDDLGIDVVAPAARPEHL